MLLSDDEDIYGHSIPENRLEEEGSSARNPQSSRPSSFFLRSACASTSGVSLSTKDKQERYVIVRNEDESLEKIQGVKVYSLINQVNPSFLEALHGLGTAKFETWMYGSNSKNALILKSRRLSCSASTVRSTSLILWL